jgi:type IV pilus assembly protein PilO
MAIGANLTKREQKLIAVSMVAILAIGGYWYGIYNPAQKEINVLAARVDSLDAANRRARNDMAKGNADSLRLQAATYAAQLRALREYVPLANEVPTLLENVSTAARRAGLDIAGVEPLPILPGDQFDTYKYKITVIGGYHPLGQFLGNVGSLKRIVAPVGLELKIAQLAGDKRRGIIARPSRRPESKITAVIEIETYVARTTPIVARAEGASEVGQ